MGSQCLLKDNGYSAKETRGGPISPNEHKGEFASPVQAPVCLDPSGSDLLPLFPLSALHYIMATATHRTLRIGAAACLTTGLGMQGDAIEVVLLTLLALVGGRTAAMIAEQLRFLLRLDKVDGGIGEWNGL